VGGAKTTLASRLPPRSAVQRTVLRLEPGTILAAVLAALLVSAVSAANGGYAPTSWGWVTISLAWVAVLVLLLRHDVSIGLLEGVVILAYASFVVWSLGSALWSGDAGVSVLSAERALVYATAFITVAIGVRSRAYGALVAGVWAGATLVCGYGVLTRLYPDRFLTSDAVSGRRLSEPVGYWNSLGLLAAVGILVAVGLVSSTRSRALAGAAAASLVPLSLALYFTYSRGSLLALAAGAVLVLVLDPRRLRFALAGAVTGAAAGIAVIKAAHLSPLTTVGASVHAAASAGSTLMRVAVLCAALAAAAGVLLVDADRRLDVPRAVRLAFAAALVAVLLASVAVVSARYGSPASIAHRAWHSFTAKPPKHAGPTLNSRLLTLSNNGRVELWRVAWHDFRAHPLNGSGAGTYYAVWVQNRTSATQVRNAHSLYLETLAELGAPGLLLLLVALLTPLIALARERRAPLVVAATGGYVAFLVHAAFDWDWQLPGVALAPLLLGAALLAVARPAWRTLRADRARRLAAAGVLVAVAAGAAFALVGNKALADARTAARESRWDAAESRARRAVTLQPWSAEPWQALGEAQLQAGDLPAARQSFRNGIATSSRDWQLWLDLALASDGKARAAAAQQALALNPLSTEIRRIQTYLGIRV
jgi:O-antigen ligase